ncbi:MAG: selenium cofactor biosynthesis protein YqeC [Chloroflexota bacterium]|nr:selenium cofactor biosynthesis protein YqeC [Chloroflexota bacterium]
MNLSSAIRLEAWAAKPVIALIGAGGKSTLLFRLGNELAQAGYQTLLSTTTKLGAHQVDDAAFTLLASDPQLLARELPTSLRGYRQVLALSGEAPGGKVLGLPPEIICQLLGLADVQAVVVEADGSRRRPIKAPADHEPVVSACTNHMLTVAGMAGIGKPLSADWVHRPALVASLTGLSMGEPLTPEAVAALLTHPRGGAKGGPEQARKFLYLNLTSSVNKPCERANQLTAAREIADLVIATQVNDSGAVDDMALSGQGHQAVLIGNARGDDPVIEVYGSVVAIVLAAGEGGRMGPNRVKQLLPWGAGNTLVGHVADTALAARLIQRVVVVLGYQAGAVEESLGERPVARAENPEWQRGQSSSVRAGLQTALASMPNLSGAIFLLADQPDVLPNTIDLLVEAHRRTLASIVVPRYQGGARGNPVLFDRRVFPQLMSLAGDTGGRALFDDYGDAVQSVPIEQAAPRGIESWEDYRRRTGAIDGEGRQ